MGAPHFDCPNARQGMSCADAKHACVGMCAGHSLGGAVAVLATLRLLRQLPAGAQPALSCNVFACPAIGNAALALYVKEHGWEHYFNNLLVPGRHPQDLIVPDGTSFEKF